MDALTITEALAMPNAPWPDEFSIHIPDDTWVWVPSVTKFQLQMHEAIDAIVGKGYDVFSQHDRNTRRTTIRATRHTRTQHHG